MTQGLCQYEAACRLIPLEKQPVVRPIGIVQVVRRIIGKVVIKPLKRDDLNATGLLQLYAGKDANEAAIHVYTMSNKENIEAVFIVDTSDAFNLISREAFLHNSKFLY